MNPAAWIFLGVLAAVVLGFAAWDLWLYRRRGGAATISTGIRQGGAPVAFFIGAAWGFISGALARHWFFYAW